MGKRKKKSGFMKLILLIWLIVKNIFLVLDTIIGWISFVLVFVGRKIYRLFVKQNDIVNKKIANKKALKSRDEAKYSKFNEVKKLNGNLNKFENKMFKSSSIGIILGARGTGKSAIGMKVLENVVYKTNKNAYAMGFNSKNLPSWITVVKDIKDVSNNSVILVDETGISFSSRSSMSDANKLLSELLFVARHKDLSVLFISQNSSNIEINAIRQADFLVLKPSSLLQKDFERKKIKDIYGEVSEHFKEFKNLKGLTYIYSDAYCGFVENKLPSFWSEKVSKSFK